MVEEEEELSLAEVDDVWFFRVKLVAEVQGNHSVRVVGVATTVAGAALYLRVLAEFKLVVGHQLLFRGCVAAVVEVGLVHLIPN